MERQRSPPSLCRAFLIWQRRDGAAALAVLKDLCLKASAARGSAKADAEAAEAGAAGEGEAEVERLIQMFSSELLLNHYLITT